MLYIATARVTRHHSRYQNATVSAKQGCFRETRSLTFQPLCGTEKAIYIRSESCDNLRDISYATLREIQL